MPGGFAPVANAGPCPCGGGAYASCCGPLHRGDRSAETAEQLMRSRYAAFARGEIDYLLATHHEPERSESERRRSLEFTCRRSRWLGLKIIATERGGPEDLEGIVRFEARHGDGVLTETSLFQRLDGDWLYIRAQELDNAVGTIK